MNIKELIKKLQDLEKKYGSDTEVVVKYRDEGGEYLGVDYDLYLYEDDGEILL